MIARSGIAASKQVNQEPSVIWSVAAVVERCHAYGPPAKTAIIPSYPQRSQIQHVKIMQERRGMPIYNFDMTVFTAEHDHPILACHKRMGYRRVKDKKYAQRG